MQKLPSILLMIGLLSPIDGLANGAKNLKQFQEYFSSIKYGYAEGVYRNTQDGLEIYKKPNRESIVLEYLSKGDLVHIMNETGEFAKIGKDRYVIRAFLVNLGLKTY